MNAGSMAKNAAAFILCALLSMAGSVTLCPFGPAALAACRMLGLGWTCPLAGVLLGSILGKTYAGGIHALCYFCLSYLFKNRRGSTKGQGLLMMCAALLTAPYFYISSWKLAFTGIAQLAASTVAAAAFFRGARCMRRLIKDRPVKAEDVSALLLCQGVVCGALAAFAAGSLNFGSLAACLFTLLWSASPYCVTAAALAGCGAALVAGDGAYMAATVCGALCASLLDGWGRWGRGAGFAMGALLSSFGVNSAALPMDISLAAGVYLLLPLDMPSFDQGACEKSALSLLEERNRVAASALLGISNLLPPGEDDMAKRQIQAVSRALISAPREQKGLSLECAVASLPKAGCRKAGDTAEVRELPFGKLVMLSDGMGSGINAKRESMEAVSIIGDLISSGVEETEALYCANRLLMEKGEFDMYATVDVMTFHYATGIAEFFKLGACPSFVVRADEVTELAGETLPIGIVASACPAVKELPLKRGDVIFMMTDGVYDTLARELVDFLISLACHSPSLAAKALVQQAARKGRSDDMTVLAMRVK